MSINVDIVSDDNSIKYPKLFKNKKTGTIAVFTSQYNCIILSLGKGKIVHNKSTIEFACYDYFNCLRPVWEQLPKGTQVVLTQD